MFDMDDKGHLGTELRLSFVLRLSDLLTTMKPFIVAL